MHSRDDKPVGAIFYGNLGGFQPEQASGRYAMTPTADKLMASGTSTTHGT
jgi:hypothetical protein